MQFMYYHFKSSQAEDLTSGLKEGY